LEKATFKKRMNDNTGLIGFDPVSQAERQAWINGEMTDEEFDALCEQRIKEHYKKGNTK